MGNEPFNEGLLKEFRNGDERACRLLYTQFYRSVCYFVKNIVDNIDQAEDITSESFIKLWAYRETMVSVSQVKSFLYTSSRNAALNYLKALRVRSRSQDDLVRTMESSAEQDHFMARMIKAQLLQHIYDEIERLPPQLHAVFKLLYVEGLTTKEIATQLDIREQSVRNAKTKALAILRHTLTKSNVLISLAIAINIIIK